MSMPIPGPNERLEVVEIVGEIIVLDLVTEYLKELSGIKAIERVIQTGDDH